MAHGSRGVASGENLAVSQHGRSCHTGKQEQEGPRPLLIRTPFWQEEACEDDINSVINIGSNRLLPMGSGDWELFLTRRVWERLAAVGNWFQRRKKEVGLSVWVKGM